jgi:hypothetical protein
MTLTLTTWPTLTTVRGSVTKRLASSKTWTRKIGNSFKLSADLCRDGPAAGQIETGPIGKSLAEDEDQSKTGLNYFPIFGGSCRGGRPKALA